MDPADSQLAQGKSWGYYDFLMALGLEVLFETYQPGLVSQGIILDRAGFLQIKGSLLVPPEVVVHAFMDGIPVLGWSVVHPVPLVPAKHPYMGRK